MPRRQEHLKAARALLGHADPLVHLLMDRAIERLGPRHRYVSHNAEYVRMIRHLLGEEAALEATLHLLQDWGLVDPQDYAFFSPPRRRSLAGHRTRGGRG
ncbi:MAG: hypothetical protein QHH27_06250 [Clostridia bacterium]|nr:hypothetical protein [Clostridia bacterium]MDH7573136.1 hypothetical protein [Clostridia bacterium]